jgi:hypothetical protein
MAKISIKNHDGVSLPGMLFHMKDISIVFFDTIAEVYLCLILPLTIGSKSKTLTWLSMLMTKWIWTTMVEM